MIQFHFNSATQKHFARHCHGSQKAGGTFLPLIDHTSKLVDIAHKLEPIEDKEQGRMRKALYSNTPSPLDIWESQQEVKSMKPTLNLNIETKSALHFCLFQSCPPLDNLLSWPIGISPDGM